MSSIIAVSYLSKLLGFKDCIPDFAGMTTNLCYKISVYEFITGPNHFFTYEIKGIKHKDTKCTKNTKIIMRVESRKLNSHLSTLDFFVFLVTFVSLCLIPESWISFLNSTYFFYFFFSLLYQL
jgi:hypothetical protein